MKIRQITPKIQFTLKFIYTVSKAALKMNQT